MQRSEAKPHVAANLTFIEARALTGPGYYAAQVFEGLAAMADAGQLPFRLHGYVQDGARHHFSDSANAYLTGVGTLRGRAGRVAFEQLMLPFRSKRDKVDLLWSPGFVSPLWGARVLVATVCDMYYSVVPEVVEPRQRQYWKTMIPMTARVCRALITISENSKRDMVNLLPVRPEQVYVTPLASRLNRRDFPVTEPEIAGPYILLVANTTSNKNCERVMAAIALLRTRGRPIRLAHIGNDIDGRLRAAAREAGVDDLLLSLGKVSDATLANAYQHCRATIVASTYEGFGMPAAEAQAMGAPLICSNRSALPEAAGGLEREAALFVDPFDIGQIADAIDRIAADEELRTLLTARGLEQAQMMTWQRTVQQTVSAFEAALA
ncbi:glycosyltransferase family 4 protein [Sphingomonas paucimobilis]|uniref:glycosyltransferase family 4 protein n=1 Tax=Sphingomonas paucimobilis TaxID=13689 RepID=UPI000DE4B671